MSNARGSAPTVARREMLGLAALPLLFCLPVIGFEAPKIARWWRARAERRALLDVVSDLLIPATGTQGSLGTAVPSFVWEALQHGLDGTRSPGASAAIVGASTFDTDAEPEGSRRLLTPIGEELDVLAKGNFLKATAPQQLAALTALDAHAFTPGQEDHPWHKIKDLILTGYYTSETGGSRELNYELVPGRFDPDVPITPGMHAYSSDWTAVDFG
jgi:hypothetical protein